MPSNYTQHYSLSQWEADDIFSREDFNADNAKTDAAIKAEADARAAAVRAVDQRVDGLSTGKADAAALTALTQTVAQKADASTVTALTQAVAAKADAATLTALTQTVNGKADAAALSTLTQTVAQKADTSALSALQTTVAQKADASALSALQTTVAQKADASALAAQTARIDQTVQRLDGAQQSELLGTYQWPSAGTKLNIDLTAFDLSKYVSLDIWLSRLRANSGGTVYCTINNVTDKVYYENGDIVQTLEKMSIAALYNCGSAQCAGGGYISIDLHGPILSGTRIYSTVYEATRGYPHTHLWGLGYYYAKPETLCSIQLTSSCALTGGTVYVAGRRF